ncbi:hypothetical protein M3231_15300 [Neobacillus mesonae]|nr:hypothetical protein [Neobacillus mesonae]
MDFNMIVAYFTFISLLVGGLTIIVLLLKGLVWAVGEAWASFVGLRDLQMLFKEFMYQRIALGKEADGAYAVASSIHSKEDN